MRIGFIGFGEAGFSIARGLSEAGINGICAYDINTNTDGLGERIRSRAEEAKVGLVESNAALARNCDILLCTVTANSAAEAASQTAPHLQPRHFYADLNS